MSSQAPSVWLRDLAPEEFNDLLDALAEGVIGVDAEYRVVGINQAACRMLEIDKRQAYMKPCERLFGEGAAARLDRIRRALRQSQPGEDVCWRWTAPSGLQRALRFLAAPSYETPHHGRLGVLVFQDETPLARLRRELADRRRIGDLVGKAPAMTEVFRHIEQAARSNAPVLIEGQSGTGKELVARVIHAHSRFAAGPFRVIDCAVSQEYFWEAAWQSRSTAAPAPAGGSADIAPPDSRAGARTSGSAARRLSAAKAASAQTGRESDNTGSGRPRPASGTLFFDEVGLLSPAGQTRLLRLIEQRPRRAAAKVAPFAEYRIIAASTRPLLDLVAAGKFREDLYLRLRSLSILLPPLRQRREDIPLLAEHFLALVEAETGRTVPRLSRAVVRRMLDHAWPGNVRQLRSVVEQAALRAEGPEIQPDDLPPEFAQPEAESAAAAGSPTKPAAAPEDHQREVLRRTLEATGWNVAKAARRLKISRTTIYERIRRLGLSRPPE